MDSKISQLASVSPLLLTDVFPLVRGAANNKATLADLLGLTERRNWLANGDFRRASYGSSIVLTTSWQDVMDRWKAVQTGAAGMTLNQVDAYAVGQGSRKCLQVMQTSNAAGTAYLVQAMESMDSVRMQGRDVSMRFAFSKGPNWTGGNLTVSIHSGTALDSTAASMGVWGGAALVAQGVAVPSAAWVEFTLSGNVAAGANQVGVMIQCTPSGAAVDANSYLYLADVSLTIGSKAPDRYPMNPIALEDVLCQRWVPSFEGAVWVPAVGPGTGATGAVFTLAFPVEARIAPTGIAVSNVGHYSASNGLGGIVCTNIVHGGSASKFALPLVTTHAAGIVAGDCYMLAGNNASSRLVATGAAL